MTQREIFALSTYLSFLLETFCDEFAPQLPSPLAVDTMYERAYQILHDMEVTLDTQREIDANSERKNG